MVDWDRLADRTYRKKYERRFGGKDMPDKKYYVWCVRCGWDKEVEKEHTIDYTCPKCGSPKLVIEEE